MQTSKYFIALVFLVVGFLLGVSFSNSQNSDPSSLSEISDMQNSGNLEQASIMIDNGYGTVTVYPYIFGREVAPTVYSALSEVLVTQGVFLQTTSYPGQGVLVEQIGDLHNSKDGRFWQYWVNHQYAMIASDEMQISPGDLIEWKFLITQPRETGEN